MMRMLAAALFLLMAPSHASAGKQENADAVQIGAVIAVMNAAASRLDAEAFMACYWKSSSLAITFDGHSLRGWETILTEQRKWWSDKNAGIAFKERRPAEITSQGPGVATSIQWMSVTSAGSGAKPADMVITSVWRKRPEGWRIVLAHESVVP